MVHQGPPRSTANNHSKGMPLCHKTRSCITSSTLHQFFSTSSIFSFFSYFYLISIFSYITIFEVNSRQQSLRQQRAQQLVGQGGQQRQVPRRKTGESWEENEKNMENTNEIGINWH
jgi:hypothetical protein